MRRSRNSRDQGGGSALPGPRLEPGGASLDLIDVTHVFDVGGNSRLAVQDVSLHVDAGEFVSVVGPSGCGKSTLLNILAGFARPWQGQALTDGAPVAGPGADRGMVFQQHRLFPWMSVRHNVEFGPRMAGASRGEATLIAMESLELVGLADVAERAPYELSGGMQQRAAIARALAGRPRVLLLDEPFSALDALTRERLQDELLRIWERSGVTVLFVTHSVDEAVYLSTRVVVMSAHPGEILLDSPMPWLGQDPRHRRSDPRFGVLREQLSGILRTEAFA